MPLLIHVAMWWLIGLRVGADSRVQSIPLLWMVIIGIGLFVVPWFSSIRKLNPKLLAPFFALMGFVIASSAQRERTACIDQIFLKTRQSAVWALLEREATQGALIRARIQESETQSRCRISGWLQVARGSAGKTIDENTEQSSALLHAEAGMLVGVYGNPMRLGNSLRIGEARFILEEGRPDVPGSKLLRWRDQIGRTIDGLFGDRSPLVRALLIADQDDIPRDMRDLFADAGLVHMLSVSGMHVAIIASALLALGAAARFPRRWAELSSFIVVVFYVALLGFPAPAVRSAVMLIVIAGAARLQRPVHEWTALALGAVVPTIDPLVVTDLGWQLSVGGMAALVAARAFRRRWRAWGRVAGLKYRRPRGYCGDGCVERWPAKMASLVLYASARIGSVRGLGGWFVQEMFTGVVATIITAPIIAWTFGRISVIAPLSSLPGGLVIALLQPALFLTLVVAPLTPVAAFLADATQPLMALLDLVAQLAAAVPGAVIPVAPTLLTATCAALAAGCVLRGSASRRQLPWWIAGLTIIVIALWIPILRGGSGKLEMHVLDVGQGDAVALRTPRGNWIVVDAGPRSKNSDAARRVIIPYVRRMGGDVVLFVLSHAHDDHAGGAATLVRALKPALWWEPAFVTASPGYSEALEAVAESGTRWERVRPGNSFKLDGVTLRVLAPDSVWTAAQQNANETSVVIRVEYGAHRFLLTGDAEREEENWLVDRWGDTELSANVLKVGHHGSRTSSSDAFLNAVRPQIAVVSLGTGNRYGHPSSETVGAFLDRRVPLLRTDLEGTIVIRSDGRSIEVESQGDRWMVTDHQL